MCPRKWVIEAEHKAGGRRPGLRGLAERLAAMIRLDAVWLCTAPMDIRAGTDTTLAHVVAVFGAARPHHAYVFANKGCTRLKVLVHDGIGIWLAGRRLHAARSLRRR